MNRLKYWYGNVWYALSRMFWRTGRNLVTLSGECAHEAACLQEDFNTQKRNKFVGQPITS